MSVTNFSLPHSITAERMLYSGFALFILVQFVISAAVVTTLSFYLLVAPALIWLLYDAYGLRKQLMKSNLLRCFIALFIFIILHALFFTDDMDGTSKTIRNSFATIGFMLSAVAFFYLFEGERLQRFLKAMVIFAALGALYSLYRYYGGYMDTSHRLIPIGRASHQILGAHAFGVGGLVALYLSSKSERKKERIFHLFACAVIGYMILLTRSRMPIFAYGVGIAAGLWAFYPLRWRTYIALTMAALCVLAAGYYFTDLSSAMLSYKKGILERGDSYRLELWQQTLERIFQAPFFGNGMRAELIPPVGAPGVTSPHNIYLGTAFYIGIPAAIFFCGCVAYVGLLACLWLWKRQPTGSLAAVILIQGLLSGITDHAQLVKSPAPLWLIFWLPVAMIIGLQLRQRRTGNII